MVNELRIFYVTEINEKLYYCMYFTGEEMECYVKDFSQHNVLNFNIYIYCAWDDESWKSVFCIKYTVGLHLLLKLLVALKRAVCCWVMCCGPSI
jgi:hypothetical protein